MRGFGCGVYLPGPEGPPGRVLALAGLERRAGFCTPADGVAGALPGVTLCALGRAEAPLCDAGRGAPGRLGTDMPSLSRRAAPLLGYVAARRRISGDSPMQRGN